MTRRDVKKKMTIFECLTRQNDIKSYQKFTKLSERVKDMTEVVTDKFHCMKIWNSHFTRFER